MNSEDMFDTLLQFNQQVIKDIQVRCLLDKDGCLQSTLLSTNTDMATAETFLASCSTLLKILLRLRATDKQDRDLHNQERLYRCFNLPGTKDCHLTKSHLVFWACSIRLANQGGQTTHWQAQNDMSSISVDPANPSEGDLAAGGTQDLEIRVTNDCSGSQTLPFASSSGSPANLSIDCPLLIS